MGALDFLKDLGESKEKYTKLNLEKNIQEKLEYLEILRGRNLMKEDFNNELFNLYLTKKIDEHIFNQNVQKSIEAHEKIELKILSIDEGIFKKKNNELKYIGVIDKMPNDKSGNYSLNRGKASYDFVEILFNNHLKGRVLKLKDINALSDALDFKVLAVFNTERLPD